MKVSLNTIKQYTAVDLSVDQLVARINQQLGGVEAVINLGEKYKDVVIVRVLSAVKHENADKLSICVIDDGGVVSGVERNSEGHVQVVCGAPNVHEDMFAAWLPPTTVVPASYEDVEPFVLEAREIRGVKSNGMLAAPDELAIGSDHAGILEIDPDEWRPYDIPIQPGTSFAAAYGLDDVIIDIENKMFTHRPDCFGQLGVAREISAILGGVTDPSEGPLDTRFENPDWYWSAPAFDDASGLELKVSNDAPEKVPRFMAVAMSGVEVKPSPLWLRCALVAMGSKPINNIVDATNYIMLLTAQPTHAYDYDKLRGHKLGVRLAEQGESVQLLNGKTYELTSEDIVIVDGEGPVGLGGIMGGSGSEVDQNTKNIVLEVATFDMYAVRKTSMRHGLFTDALARFNKGQSPLQNSRVMSRLMAHIADSSSSAVQASTVADWPADRWNSETTLSGEISIGTEFINARLGSKLSVSQIGNLLRRANFAAYPSDDDENTLLITAPFWRTDIELPEDIVEEVGRLYGFDKLPRELPTRSIKPAAQNSKRLLKQSIRESLSRAGSNEVLTYSFVHEKVLKNAEQDPTRAYRLSNALSPDLQYYRLSVLPSLLDKVHMNIKSGHDEFTLYELGKSHIHDSLEDGLPIELESIAAVYANKKPTDGAPYYQMRRVVERLTSDHNFTVRYQSLDGYDFGNHEATRQMCAPFDPKRSAMVMCGDRPGGVIGELKQSVTKNFKLPTSTAAFELFMTLFEANNSESEYVPLSRYPSVVQDISLKVGSDVSYESVFDGVSGAMQSASEGIELQVSPVTIYQPADDNSIKTITLRVRATSHERTLREDEVTALLDVAAHAASDNVSATRI